MTYGRHVTIGAGGIIAHALVSALLRNNREVSLMSRRRMFLSGTTGSSADATEYEALLNVAPNGSAVCLLVALPCDVRVGHETGLRIMGNVARVCRDINARLAFVDRVEVYGLVEGTMTEDTPDAPQREEKGRFVNALRRFSKTSRLRAGRIASTLVAPTCMDRALNAPARRKSCSFSDAAAPTCAADR